MFCRKCGKEIENGSKFCPYCGAMSHAQQPPAGRPARQSARQQGARYRWLIALGAAVIVALSVVIIILVTGDGSNGSENGTARVVTPRKKEIKVDFTASELHNEVSGDNQLRNDQRKDQLKGKRLTISGNVAGVGRRFLTDVPYVDLYDGSLFNLVCEFSEDDVEQIMNLVKNQKVIIIGTANQYASELKNCTVITDLNNYTIVK